MLCPPALQPSGTADNWPVTDSPPAEDLIRDAIAERPELIEPGLVTVKANYHLQNSDGSRGFVDVLARDRGGLYVAIEVKRSDSTAREALHEVLKYCELLRRERGLRADQVRAVIASTTWRELLVPFSELTRTSEYPVEGFDLSIGTAFPASLTATPVQPLPVPLEKDLATVAVRADIGDPSRAEDVWQVVVPILNDVGVDDMLGVIVGNDNRTVLHVAIGTVVQGDPRVPTADEPDAIPDGEGIEYLAAVAALDRLPGFELVSPDRLRRIMQSNQLELLQVIRTGRYEDQSSLLDDADALAIAEGSLTWSQVETVGIGRPSLVLAWKRMRSRLAYTLAGNPRWSRLIDLWLDEVEIHHPNADVVLKVYNPCDLMGSLVHSGLGQDLNDLMPEIEGALDLPGVHGRMLHGALVWNGRRADVAAESIRSIYPTPSDWAIRRGSGGVWESDLKLLAALGLQYALVEFLPDGAGGPYLLSEDSGSLTRTASTGDLEWPDVVPLPAWLGIIRVEELLAEYWESMTPINGGDQWLTSGMGRADVPEGTSSD